MDVYTPLYLKWITNKDLLFSTGNFAQCYVAAWNGEEFGGEWIHVYVMDESLHCLPETVTTLLIGYTLKNESVSCFSFLWKAMPPVIECYSPCLDFDK